MIRGSTSLSLLRGVTGIAVGFKLTISSIQAHPDAISSLDDAGFGSSGSLAKTFCPTCVGGPGLHDRGVEAGDGCRELRSNTHRVDAAACKRALAALERREQELDGLAEGHPTIRLTYERLVAGPIDEVQRFLGVEPRPQLPSPETSHPPAA